MKYISIINSVAIAYLAVASAQTTAINETAPAPVNQTAPLNQTVSTNHTAPLHQTAPLNSSVTGDPKSVSFAAVIYLLPSVGNLNETWLKDVFKMK